MLSRIASAASHRSRRIALITLGVFLIGAVVGAPTQKKLKAGNSFQALSSQSARSERSIENTTGREASAGVLALVDASPSNRRVNDVARTLAEIPGVAKVQILAAHSPFISKNGSQTIVAATLQSSKYPDTVAKAIESRFAHASGVKLGGSDIANAQLNTQASHDLALAELIASPLLVILSIVIFRGLAALIPVAVGATSVMWAFVTLRIVNAFLPLSSFSLNLVIGLGLGLSIDYSLLLVWRFREELANGAEPSVALAAMIGTAGRTVLFSATTVAAAMASLLLFPERFLVSMGVGGIAVALISAASALVVVPPLLILMARRVGRVRPAPAGGAWYRLAQRVMRHPALVALVTSAGLLLVASPALHTRWSGADASVLPTNQSARVVSTQIARNFSTADSDTMVIAAHVPANGGARLRRYAAELRRVPGVTSVQPPSYLAGDLWRIEVAATGDPIYRAAQNTLARVRAVTAPFPVLVGGSAADFRDQQSSIASALPLALTVLVVTTLLVLWIMTGSVLLPFKTLLMNALTAAAATGLLVWVFQDDRFTSLLAYSGQGGIEQSDFLVIAALAFALSTDYGVMLLTRIKEIRDNGTGNREAIALGLDRTGRLISASAVLLAVAIGAFGTSKIIFLKEIGLGTAAAVLIDAFVVRALLVPALMALLGPANWWSPRWLARIHARLPFDESGLRGDPPDLALQPLTTPAQTDPS